MPRDANIFMMGIGGTGVVTVNQVLGTAALLDGKIVRGLDQTGLSQKGGPVVSHLKIFDAGRGGLEQGGGRLRRLLSGLRRAGGDRAPESRSRAAGPHDRRRVDQPGADRLDGRRTPTCSSPTAGGLQSSINRVTRKDENVYFDALGLAETLFDDHMATNMLVLGAAYQAGAIPVSAAAIEEAIKLNGVSVTMNTQAFRAGRLLVADPTLGGRRSSATASARRSRPRAR